MTIMKFESMLTEDEFREFTRMHPPNINGLLIYLPLLRLCAFFGIPFVLIYSHKIHGGVVTLYRLRF